MIQLPPAVTCSSPSISALGAWGIWMGRFQLWAVGQQPELLTCLVKWVGGAEDAEGPGGGPALTGTLETCVLGGRISPLTQSRKRMQETGDRPRAPSSPRAFGPGRPKHPPQPRAKFQSPILSSSLGEVPGLSVGEGWP